MKKAIAFLLAIITAASLCLPAFAKDVDYTEMTFDEYDRYFQTSLFEETYFFEARPAKSFLSYKLAKLSDKEIEKQAENISENALLYIYSKPSKNDEFVIAVNIERNFYLFNKKVFNKAVNKIYAKQERFFEAYGEEFDSEVSKMTKEHIAGELYTHLCLYELIYPLRNVRGISDLFHLTKNVDIDMNESVIPLWFTHAVGIVSLI